MSEVLTKSLLPFFSPRGVVVIGASTSPEKLGYGVARNLVQSGYPADRIQARGKGKGSPIADNASPEGRANNRRVEIVIEREAQTPNP